MPQPRFMQKQNLKDMLKNYAWQQEHERICSQITPNINEIKRLLNKKNELYFPTEPDTNALELKLKAMTHVPTTIEKTMTPAQLYASDSPLWAYNYTEADIRNILERLKSKPKTEESFNTVLAIIANDKNNGRMMFDEYGNIRSVGGIHGNRLQIGLSQKHNLQKINNNIERN